MARRTSPQQAGKKLRTEIARSPIAVPRTPGWLGGDFHDADTGILVGPWKSLTVLRQDPETRQEVFAKAGIDGLGARSLHAVQILPQRVVAEGYASTCQTLGYVMRGSEPSTAALWYWRALMWPSRRTIALKGLIRCVRIGLGHHREVSSAENASANG